MGKHRSQPHRSDDGLPVEMNYANIGQLARQSKDIVQLCLKDVFLHIGQTVGQGHKVSLDWYIGRLTAEHGIMNFTFFDSDSLQRREAERAKGKSIMSVKAPDEVALVEALHAARVGCCRTVLKHLRHGVQKLETTMTLMLVSVWESHGLQLWHHKMV